MEGRRMNRKEFLQLTTAGAGGFFVSGTKWATIKDDMMTPVTANTKEFVLINARLEECCIYNEYGQVKATKTGLYDLYVKDGRIETIKPAVGRIYEGSVFDAQGKLVLPGLRDMHIHIDKTFYSEPWQAEPLRGKTVQDMIDLERNILPNMLVHSTEKAEKAIDLMNSKGTYFARCQTNIEPTSGLKSLAHLQQALDNKKEYIQTEIVAFPQHGILYSNAEGLLREAAQMGLIILVD